MYSRVQTQAFLRSLPPLEALLLAFLTPCRTVSLFNGVVAAGRGNHLLVVDLGQTRDLPDRRAIAGEHICANSVWNILFIQEPGHEGLRCFGVSVRLKQDIEHGFVLVHRLPEPVSDAIHRHAKLVQKPPRTPASPPAGAGFLRRAGPVVEIRDAGVQVKETLCSFS
ncbi:hypothetical protein HNQ08_002702 [Deinococcus humi]|uniref:Uncharacterized protein n=1 Tax=Deinococcus humi TaxID=662880 RepID=A0A7W8JXL0_9DEIO|nr:hypothetical protein [Deinococcus humi]MBB5363596.1 hypothetical protein [Deinococcus humi]